MKIILSLFSGYLFSVGVIAKVSAPKSLTPGQEVATFAGGCFWCMEPPFENLDGVISVISGYMGGTKLNPTYEEVSSGSTGHMEVIQITFDPQKVSYQKLLEVFWQNVDPTDNDGQFVDRGQQYKTAIFFHSELQKSSAQKSIDELNKKAVFAKPIVTSLIEARDFFPAEDYHQDYYKKNPIRYKYYRHQSGRDQFLTKTWKGKSPFGATEDSKKASESAAPALQQSTGQFWKQYKKPSPEALAKTLEPLQFKVTQKEGTEPPNNNKYWDNHDKGIYVDLLSGEPLFSSTDKFDSGTGWPSFTKPIEKENIVTKIDKRLFTTRTEVRSKFADNHLGHVFQDGPKPTGLRYCINSASLKFIPFDQLKAKGYQNYLYYFDISK